jgi:two-component system, chemotaxis family, chemotaxis protein CheY
MTACRILSVGQCSMDHGNITQAVQGLFPAEVEPVALALDAIERLRKGSYAVVLVNRHFDADSSEGIEFIRTLKADAKLRDVPVMLISNLHEAQAEAVAAGAVPGFGKAALKDDLVRQRLEPFLGAATRA